MLDKTSVQSGLQYSAQKIESKDLWIELGGIKSGRFIDDSMAPKEPLSEKDSVKANSSHYLSYTFLEIAPKDSIQKDNISILIDPSLSNQELNSSSKSKKNVIDFGFHCKISSTRFTTFQEGWLHRHIVSLLNQIEGIEYQSYNYLPTLRLHRQLSTDTLSSILTQLFQHLINVLKSKFSEIDQIEVILNVGAKSLQKSRLAAESVLFNKRKIATEKVIPYSSSIDQVSDFLAFTFDQSIAPYAAIILTPWTCDPAGYLFYSDFSPEHFPEDLLGQYGIIHHPLGKVINSVSGEFEGINTYFAQLTFQSIVRVELFGLDFPLPGSINSDVIIFSIPEHHGLGVLNSSYQKKIFKKISYSKLKDQFAEGHQHPHFKVLSQVEFQTALIQSSNLLLSNIVWMNSSLLEILKDKFNHLDFSSIMTELQAKSTSELPVVERNVESGSTILESEQNNTKSADALDIKMIQDLLQREKKPLHFKEASITLASADGSTYDVEFTNLQLTADSVHITKKE